MSKFQISYSINSKTQTIELFADTYDKIKDIFNILFVGDLLEIREVVHEDKTIIKDDKDYIHSANVKVLTADRKFLNSFKIPKLRKNINDIQLETLVLSNIKINNLKPDIIQISKNYK